MDFTDLPQNMIHEPLLHDDDSAVIQLFCFSACLSDLFFFLHLSVHVFFL